MTTVVQTETITVSQSAVVVKEVPSSAVVSTVDVERIVAKVSEGNVIVTGVIGPATSRSISASSDIVLTELEDGATLVYSAQTSRWHATTKLEKQVISGGFF